MKVGCTRWAGNAQQPKQAFPRCFLKVGLLSNLDFYLDKAAIAAMGGGGGGGGGGSDWFSHCLDECVFYRRE